MQATNRLANEKSPYLLQHAHNPVDWFAWGDEAFAKARSENKLIFLSVGYSTCHWCHVMERESFENEQIAEILNRHYVSVKVDREERPDVDRIYMTFVQALSGGGGWPMSVWLTPELKPFFGGTYFPPENRHGQAGLASILAQIADAWTAGRDQIVESARDVVEQLTKAANAGPVASGTPAIDAALLESGYSFFRRMFDTHHGGFGDAPKFPRPAVFNFLLRYYARTHNSEALDMVLLTLDEMARGGMNDQLGGGFHRYSVDDRWFVPHFEKMLYDQAQLAISYIEAFQITGEPEFAETARRTLDYVLRDLRAPGGPSAFFCAEDADSPDPEHPERKSEGAFYIWRDDEIARLLEAPVADWFRYRYGFRASGNVDSDPHGEFGGKNILYQAHTIEETAANFGRDIDQVSAALLQAERILLDYRSRRPRPHLDDKVLTAWNGLMISAFALAGAVLDEPRYREAASGAAGFILSRMYKPESGVLIRSYREGAANVPGFLEDYAFFVQGLLDLYETGFDFLYLETAQRLTRKQLELFEDREGGGFYSAAADDSLVMRPKDDYDGAEPSGNSVALLNILRLARMTGAGDFDDAANRTMNAFASRLGSAPAALPQMLAACEFYLGEPREIVIAGERNAADTVALAREVFLRFDPGRVLMLVDSPETASRLAGGHPALASIVKVGGKAAAYVCRNYACQMPVSEPEKLAELLK
jgi:uncharacterized protein